MTATITGVVYDGSQISVTWAPSNNPQVTFYQVNVTYAAEPGTDPNNIAYSAINSTPAGASVLPITQPISLRYGPLDSNVEYFVQVICYSGIISSPTPTGEMSQFAPLISRLPELLAVYYDGTDVHFEWTPTPQATEGYSLNLAVGTNVYFDTVSSPTATHGVIPASLLPPEGLSVQSLPCVATVSALGSIGTSAEIIGDGQVLGNSASATLPAGVPTLTPGACFYQKSTGLTASWTPLDPSASIVEYRIAVYSTTTEESYRFSIPGATASGGTITFPRELSPTGSYNLRIVALNRSGAGVASAPLPVVTTLPQLSSVVYNASAGTIDLTWNPVTNTSAIGSFTAQAYDVSGAKPGATTTGIANTATSASIKVPDGGFSAATAWGVCIRALGTVAASVTGYGDTQPLYVVTPQISRALSDGKSVNLFWNPVSAPALHNPAGYVISLAPAAGGAAASTSFVTGATASGGTILLPDSSAYTVQIAQTGGCSTGPQSAALQPITTAPTGIGLTSCDPVTGAATLGWNGITVASGYTSGYTLRFLPSGSTQSAPSNSFPIPSSLFVPGAKLSVAIGCNGKSGANISLAGPESVVTLLPTAAPSLLFASFDGAKATACWEPVGGASSYTASVLGKTATSTTVITSQKVNAPATTAEISFTAIKGTDYSIVVQATCGSTGIGPASSAIDLFEPALFLSTSTSTGATPLPPFGYPATVLGTVLDPDSAKTGEPFVLYLSDTGGGNDIATPVYSNTSAADSAFILNANTGKGKDAYPYTLTINNAATVTNNPWQFSDATPIRNGLANEYQAFLRNIDTAGGAAASFGILQIQQLIGRMMPQTFAEQLYYNFGLTFPGSGVPNGYVDLRPGMILRVASNPYQSVPGQTSFPAINGYAAGSVVDYDVGSFYTSAGIWNTGFDNFIAQLASGGALTVSPPIIGSPPQATEQGIAEAADLYYPAFRGNFYRLFSPATLVSPSGAGVDNILSSSNFAIASAGSYGTMAKSTNVPSATNNVVYFRGRAVVKACFWVLLNGARQVVPVGTTLANLLESAGRQLVPTPLPLRGILLERGLNGVVLDPSAPPSASSHFVRTDWTTVGATLYGPNWGPTSLPLLPGDRITLV